MKAVQDEIEAYLSDFRRSRVIFTIRAGAYSFEAANPRHEHEWRLFETVKLPEGKSSFRGP